MLRPHHHRRSKKFPIIFAAIISLFLLLLSLSLLYSRLTNHSSSTYLQSYSSLFDDADNDAFDIDNNDQIDVLDNENDDLKLDTQDDEPESEDDPTEPDNDGVSNLYWDHTFAVHRRSFGKSSSDQLDPIATDFSTNNKIVQFSSDDLPLDEAVRKRMYSIRNAEDLLMQKNSPLREGWAGWLVGKGDFLRRDKMLKSGILEILDPKNHFLLHDPDLGMNNGLTKGDRLVLKSIMKEMEKVPFEMKSKESVSWARRNLKEEEDVERRWGWYEGVEEGLGFTEFVNRFFEVGGCRVRVFMVWNSPAWMFGVRQQRAVESLFKVHGRDVCVVVLSEFLELDFFKSFVQDGFKVAVAMPDLDELLKDTPTEEFSSLWYEWRRTKHYPVHYSELIRLAVLYKFGGVYLDSDVIVFKPLYSLKNSVGVENHTNGTSIFNGAVLAFDKESPFLLECMREFYSTYDDTRLRWNGADLLSRVINKLDDKEVHGIKMESPLSFFPISSSNITRYFSAADNETVEMQEENLFGKIVNESTAFHFWNSATSALVPEPSSLVERLLNFNCLRCHDIL